MLQETHELPAIPGVGSFDLQTEAGGFWSGFQAVAAGQQICFAPGTDGFEFEPLDAAGLTEDLTDPVLFDVSFETAGEFAGVLSETTPNATQPEQVPEPSTLVLSPRPKQKRHEISYGDCQRYSVGPLPIHNVTYREGYTSNYDKQIQKFIISHKRV